MQEAQGADLVKVMQEQQRTTEELLGAKKNQFDRMSRELLRLETECFENDQVISYFYLVIENSKLQANS